MRWAHIGLVGSFGALLVGGCGARAVSHKTSLLFLFFPCVEVGSLLE